MRRYFRLLIFRCLFMLAGLDFLLRGVGHSKYRYKTNACAGYGI